jgi:hypothetical protein
MGLDIDDDLIKQFEQSFNSDFLASYQGKIKFIGQDESCCSLPELNEVSDKSEEINFSSLEDLKSNVVLGPDGSWNVIYES